MKIEKLNLKAYGAFTEKILDFSQGDRGLHIIYGDNEAGKSTSMRALSCALFGFPNKTNDDYIHKKSQLRIGCILSNKTGDKLHFIRKKGNKNTILSPDSSIVLPNSSLDDYLSTGMNEVLFKQMHAINHQSLVDGGDELLSSSGDLGQTLMSAAIGEKSIPDILKELEKSADDLFTPRKTTTPVNKAISNYKKSAKEAKQMRFPVVQWKKMQAELSELQEDIRQIDLQITEKNDSKNSLERLQRSKETMAEYHSLLQQLSQYQADITIAKDMPQKRRQLKLSLHTAEEKENTLSQRVEKLEQETADLNLNTIILEYETEILSLQNEAVRIDEIRKDQIFKQAKQEELSRKIQTFLADYRLVDTEAEKLRNMVKDKKQYSEIGKKNQSLKNTEEELSTQKLELEKEKARLHSLIKKRHDSTFDIENAQLILKKAQKKGDLQNLHDETQNHLKKEKFILEHEFSRLGHYEGDFEDLSKMALPAEQRIDDFINKFEDFQESEKRLLLKIQESQSLSETAKAELKVLHMKHEIPSVQDLFQLREERDQKWSIIKNTWQEDQSKHPVTHQSHDFLIDFEKIQQSCDQLSDRLRLNADRVLKNIELEQVLVQEQKKQVSWKKEWQEVLNKKEDIKRQWLSLWQQFAIKAGTPKVMKQWLFKVENWVDKYKRFQTLLFDATEIEQFYDINRSNIEKLILQFRDQFSPQVYGLDQLIVMLEQKIAQELQSKDEKEIELRKMEDLDHRLSILDSRFKELNSKKEEWQLEWQQLNQDFPLPKKLNISQILELIEALILYFAQVDELKNLGTLLLENRKRIDTFESEASNLAKRLLLDTLSSTVSLLVKDMSKELSLSKEKKAALQKIKQQKEEFEAELQSVKFNITKAKADLEEMMLKASSTNDAELELICERAETKEDLKDRLERSRTELLRVGDGLSLKELELEFAQGDLGSLQLEISRVKDNLRVLSAKRDDLLKQKLSLEFELKDKDGRALCAKAAEDAELYLNEIVDNSRKYLQFKVAALILKKKIEDYRRKNEAPILAKASDLFSRLTLGNYKMLRDELDTKQQQIIVGVMRDNQEVSVSAMSEGTRDQLYLAFRLATLLLQPKNSEKMPFIVDDIMVSFDDSRTKVCLEILLEISSDIQVLLFTHHKRVLHIAQDIQPNVGLFLHDLGQ